MSADEALRDALIDSSRNAAVRNRDHFAKHLWLPNVMLCAAGGLLAVGLLRRSGAPVAIALVLGSSALFMKRSSTSCEASLGRSKQNNPGRDTSETEVSSFDEASRESFPASDSPARSTRRSADLTG
jgi:hypothetical protein